MERMNGEIRDREKTMKGLKMDASAILTGYQLFHNYIRPHDPFHIDANYIKFNQFDFAYSTNGTFLANETEDALPCEWLGMGYIVFQNAGQFNLTISSWLDPAPSDRNSFPTQTVAMDNFNTTVQISDIPIYAYSQLSTHTPSATSLEPTSTALNPTLLPSKSEMTLSTGLTISVASFLLTLIVFVFLSFLLPYIRNRLKDEIWQKMIDDYAHDTLIGGLELVGVTSLFVIAYHLYSGWEILIAFSEVLLGIILGFALLFLLLKTRKRLSMFSPFKHKGQSDSNKDSKTEKVQPTNSIPKE